MVRTARAGRTERMAVTGVMGAIFVMAVAATAATIMKGATIVAGAITVKGATTATTATTATIATIVTAGAKGPLPTAGTMTGPQAVGSLTVRPVRRTASARSAMTAMVRAGGLRVRRAMTGRAAMTVRIGPTVQTGRIVMAVRTGRTETAVVTRTVPPGVGEMEARAVALVVAPAVIKTAAVTAARTNALALAVASPSGPEIPLTMPHLRQRCGF